MVKVAILLAALSLLGNSKWTEEHNYSPSTSSQVANGIKSKLLGSISLFVDQTFAKKLEADLNNNNDGSRQLKEISVMNAAQVFSFIGLNDPGCDKNGDKVINGNELKCLNYAWKAYIPK